MPKKAYFLGGKKMEDGKIKIEDYDLNKASESFDNLISSEGFEDMMKKPYRRTKGMNEIQNAGDVSSISVKYFLFSECSLNSSTFIILYFIATSGNFE